jgi:hypothetical protein
MDIKKLLVSVITATVGIVGGMVIAKQIVK